MEAKQRLQRRSRDPAFEREGRRRSAGQSRLPGRHLAARPGDDATRGWPVSGVLADRPALVAQHEPAECSTSASTRVSRPCRRRVPTTRPRARRCRTTPTASVGSPTAATSRITPAFRPTRASSTSSFTDSAHTFTQEVRLVSKAGPDNVIRLHRRRASTRTRCARAPGTIAIPGNTRSVNGAGLHGTYCRRLHRATAPGDVTFQQIDTQNFTDKSVFGELTWHFMPRRPVHVRRTALQPAIHRRPVLRRLSLPDPPARRPRIESPASKTVWKINPSYRVRQGPVRVRVVVAGLPPRRRELRAADRTVRRRARCWRPTSPTRPTTTRPDSRGASATAFRTRSRCSTSNGTAADLLEPAVRQPCGLQRQHGRVEGLRARIQRPAVRAAPRLTR